MCGIFSCVSKKGSQNLIAVTLKGLKILEYRGYDSAGISYRTTNGDYQTIKAVGEMSKLEAKIKQQPLTTMCLGHTRWATNGIVNITNSHPHLSANGKIAVVHNGIIENYQQCVTLLNKQNIKLQTPVDTEVIPNILCLLQHNKHNIHQYLAGQYVFCAGEMTSKNTLFLAKKGNLPLYLGCDANNIYVTSDTLALPQSTTKIITLDNLDTCEIKGSKIAFFNNGTPINKDWQPFTQSFIASNKNGFQTYMEKEIFETPHVLEQITTQYHQDKHLIALKKQFRKLLSQSRCVHICGCGTSYHAALILASLCESQLHIRAKAHISSEFTPATLHNETAIAIVISQSGETADTLAAMNILQAHHIPIISLCNVVSSTIAQNSQITFPLLCGPEIAVASTKVFCAAILVGCLLFKDYTTISCDCLIKDTTKSLHQARQVLPLSTNKPNKIFFIGKGLNYFLALEAALKVKEVTYTHCEGYPANELKHGPLSMIDQNSLAIVFPGGTDNAVTEIKARGGQVICLPAITDDNPLSFITQIIAPQIFALDLATKMGINPDKPRNLAKSVTVL